MSSCSKKVYNYELLCNGVGVNGKYLVKCYSYASTFENARKKVKKDAVHGVLFKGVSANSKKGCVNQDPICNVTYEEKKEWFDNFFDSGLQMLVDGADEAKLTVQLKKELKAMQVRHASMIKVAQSWVDIAPAMGMIGTLVGLVAMLGNMADPKAIGPAMAVALLTTLYGAMIANTIFTPIVIKLTGYDAYETTYREMIITGLQFISRGESPRNIQDQLVANLPPKEKQKLIESAA